MNKKLNSETSAETTADKSGADEVTMSSHSSANTTVSCGFNVHLPAPEDYTDIERF
jgi:hypothetical protein